MNEITIGNKTYISSKRAAEITGYAKDYIGQLCREGRVDARLIGRNWYLLEDSIREHRFGNTPKVAEESAVEAEKGVPAIDALWDSPRYEAEEQDPLVSLIPEAISEPVEGDMEANQRLERPEFMSDMRSAWKEWFSTRETEEATEEPVEPLTASQLEAETYEAVAPTETPPSTSYEPEVQVPITILRSEDLSREEEMPVSTEESLSPEAVEVEAVPTYGELQGSRPSSLVLRLVLVVAAIIFAGTALIGTGYLKIPASVPVEAAAISFISGTQTISK